MTASYLPAILVPVAGIVFPFISMAFFFIFVEREEIV